VALDPKVLAARIAARMKVTPQPQKKKPLDVEAFAARILAKIRGDEVKTQVKRQPQARPHPQHQRPKPQVRSRWFPRHRLSPFVFRSGLKLGEMWGFAELGDGIGFCSFSSEYM